MNVNPIIRDAIAASLLLGLGACGGGGDSAPATPVAPPAPSGPVFSVVETIAGQAGVRGQVDGNGDQATFNYPYGVAATNPPNQTSTGVVYLYIAGLTENIRLQQVGISGAPVSTVIGLGTSGSVDGGAATALVRAPTWHHDRQHRQFTVGVLDRSRRRRHQRCAPADGRRSAQR